MGFSPLALCHFLVIDKELFMFLTRIAFAVRVLIRVLKEHQFYLKQNKKALFTVLFMRCIPELNALGVPVPSAHQDFQGGFYGIN